MKTPTDTELNIAMCEWMGWKIWEFTGTDKHEVWYSYPNGVSKFRELPDYLSDDSPRRLLNEAEARLRPILQERYYRRLREAVGSYDLAISATARQRVIAILKTVKPEMFL